MSSQATSRITITSLKPIIKSLPASPLSAEAVQLSDALEAIAEKALASTSSTSTSASLSSSTTTTTTSNGAGSSLDALKVAGHQRRLTQMRDSIIRIRNGNAMNAYPLTGSTLTPANDPHYYTRFRNGVRNAEQGIQRPWWKIFFNIKGEE
ncbi:uncharacterized protein L201_000499 [Kwoniella dendrophila CBS 6074]|uniref:Uncharacterized protein n=1 Tax=Kwoniella dendrophila CBS 6074 TaxID=1295534 RepID=A0AAX4JML4_9TREE